MSDPIPHELSSGNVFADLGHPDPEAALAKAWLVRQIEAMIETRGWTERQAATILAIDEAELAALRRGRVRDVSIDALLRLLTRLDVDVRITLAPSPSPGQSGRITVERAAELIAAG